MDFGKKKRVGNFSILKYNKDGVPFIKVSDIAGSWAIEFAMVHKMFAYIDSLEDSDDEQWKVLNILIVSWLGATSILNADFSKRVYEAIDLWAKENGDPTPSTEEELEEQRVLAEMEEEYNKLAKDGLQQAAES